MFCCNSVGAHTMHPSVLYHHTTALSHKAHHVIAPFYGHRYPFVGAAAHLFPKNAIKMLSFSTSGKGSILLYPFRSSMKKRRRQNASSAILISPLRPSALILVFLLPATFPGCSKPVCALRRASTGKSTSDPAGLYFACAPSGKMILFTKKKITMEMPPLSTVVPML